MQFENVKEKIRKVTLYLEFILALFIIVAVIIGMFDLIRYIGLIFKTNPIDTYDLFQKFLGHVLLMVVGVELVVMLIYHTPGSVIEVLLYAVARKLLIGNEGMLEFILGIIAIAAIFLIRRFLLVEDLTNGKKVGHSFAATTYIKAINELLNTDIPEENEITIGGFINAYAKEKGIQLYKDSEIEILNIKIRVLKVRDGVLHKVAIIKY